MFILVKVPRICSLGSNDFNDIFIEIITLPYKGPSG